MRENGGAAETTLNRKRRSSQTKEETKGAETTLSRLQVISEDSRAAAFPTASEYLQTFARPPLFFVLLFLKRNVCISVFCPPV